MSLSFTPFLQSSVKQYLMQYMYHMIFSVGLSIQNFLLQEVIKFFFQRDSSNKLYFNLKF